MYLVRFHKNWQTSGCSNNPSSYGFHTIGKFTVGLVGNGIMEELESPLFCSFWVDISAGVRSGVTTHVLWMQCRLNCDSTMSWSLLKSSVLRVQIKIFINGPLLVRRCSNSSAYSILYGIVQARILLAVLVILYYNQQLESQSIVRYVNAFRGP